MFLIILLVCPIWLPVFFLFFYNEPELGAGIDPGMALTPLPSSIGRGLNPQPYDHEPSALPLDHSFCYSKTTYRKTVLPFFKTLYRTQCPSFGQAYEGNCHKKIAFVSLCSHQKVKEVWRSSFIAEKNIFLFVYFLFFGHFLMVSLLNIFIIFFFVFII
jgi:hypothetical protein